MTTIVEVVGSTARDALLATVTASQIDVAGGYRTYASSSYYTGGPIGAFGGFIRPDSDVGSGSFGPTPLFTELTGSSGEIFSTGSITITPTSSYDSFEVGLSNPLVTPNDNEVVTIRVLAHKTGSAETSSSATLGVTVRTGSIDIASQSFTLTNTVQAFQWKLSEAEKSIAVWNDLSVLCSYTMSVVTSSLEVSGSATQVEIQFYKAGVIEAPPEDRVIYRIMYD